jgi:hypothetical protein
LDFTFEILDSSTINIQFNYGGAWFEFNLFHKEDQWVLHPYDGNLLGNPDMCRLVIADLLANKPFQVLLAKERIMLSRLRTSVDVSGDREIRHDRAGGGRPDIDIDLDSGGTDELEDWIRGNSFEEILSQELQGIEGRQQLFNSLLQKMFYENLGPGDEEFDKVQEIARIYKDTAGRISQLIDSGNDFKDRPSDRRRF